MNVEVLAVGRVQGLIAGCPDLDPVISTHDKILLTDGHIDVHDAPPPGKQHGKETFQGRVTVQVKGRSLTTSKLDRYSIDRTDLVKMQAESGLMFFVGAVKKQRVKRVYYAILSPFKIQRLLDSVPAGQQSISVPMKEFPTDPERIENIVRLALTTRKQDVSLGLDPALEQEIQSFTIHSDHALELDGPVVLDPGIDDISVVLHTTGGMQLPVDGKILIQPESYTPRFVNQPVTCGGTSYSGATVRQTSADTWEVKLSAGLTLTLNPPNGMKVDVTLERTLADRLKALDFFLAVRDAQNVQFGDSLLSFNVAPSELDPDLLAHVTTLRALTELCDRLGINTGLVDLQGVNEVQLRALDSLYRALILGEEVTANLETPGLTLQNLGNRSVLVLVLPGTQPGRVRVLDPFSPEAGGLFWAGSDDERLRDPVQVTAYETIDQERLPNILNLRLDTVVDAYAAIAEFLPTLQIANAFVLELITGADRDEERREEFLDAADRLNDWLFERQGGEPPDHVNRWQIAARRDQLTPEQRSEIRRFKREITRSTRDDQDLYEIACALLLGLHEEADELIKELPAERLEKFQSWPIWKLRSAPSLPSDAADLDVE